jgi:deoxyribonucleoside regulator
MSFEENRLEVEIAFRYYYERKTQGEIAKEMGLSRIKVQRILQKCLDTGIVRITIQDPLVKCVELENRLLREFGLKEAHVVMTPSNGLFTHKQVALKGAHLLDSLIKDGTTVGVAWGRMVSEIVNEMVVSLNVEPGRKVDFVSIIGGLTSKFSVNPLSIIHRLGELYGGDVYYISAPAVVDSPDLKDAILKERSLEPIFQRMQDIDLTVVGIGNVRKYSTLHETGYLSEEELHDFQVKGAVGEVLLYHYDLQGNIIQADYHDRLIGIGLEGLKSINKVIGVATGQNKVESIVGAIRAGLINGLVTDEVTAESVLNYGKQGYVDQLQHKVLG